MKDDKTYLGSESCLISCETVKDLLAIAISTLKSGGNTASFDIPLKEGRKYNRVHINMTFEVLK